MIAIDEKRALEMYELAWRWRKAKGAATKLGVVTFREHRAGSLTIHYLPSSGRLDMLVPPQSFDDRSTGRNLHG